MRWLRWLRAAAPAALAAPAASPAFNILFIGLLGPHTAYSTSNWSSGCAGCVGCAQLHQLRWLRLLRHLRSIYCSLGFWGPILPIVLRIGAMAALAALAARSCTSCAQLRFRQRSCVSANAAKQTVTPPGVTNTRIGLLYMPMECTNQICRIRRRLMMISTAFMCVPNSVWSPGKFLCSIHTRLWLSLKMVSGDKLCTLYHHMICVLHPFCLSNEMMLCYVQNEGKLRILHSRACCL